MIKTNLIACTIFLSKMIYASNKLLKNEEVFLNDLNKVLLNEKEIPLPEPSSNDKYFDVYVTNIVDKYTSPLPEFFA